MLEVVCVECGAKAPITRDEMGRYISQSGYACCTLCAQPQDPADQFVNPVELFTPAQADLYRD